MIELTKQQRIIIIESYEQMAVQGPVMARAFYLSFFERYPQMRQLFANTTVDKQAEMLMDALHMTVRAMTPSPTNTLKSYLDSLGDRHERRYNITDEHFEPFCEVLLETMAEHLGESWTEAHYDAWDEALQQMSMLMMR